jgi:LacI family gluconate utilization system Gnt-I transcriptional repressor
LSDLPPKDDPDAEPGAPHPPVKRGRGARPSTGRVTLGDVARIAGVSSMTVSRVINRPETVSEDIRRIVDKAIEASGYVPNLLAGGLASSRTRLVAAIVPTVAHVLFSASVQYLTDRLAEEGYQVLLGLSGYPEGKREEELIKAILARVPEALYLTGTNHSPATRQRLRAAGIPIVETWDLSRPPIDMAVGFSHGAVGERVAEYFHARGHTRVTAVSAGDERALLRCSSFTATARRLGLEVHEPVITPSPSTLQMGRQGLGRLIEAGFRNGAICTSSDALAHGIVLEAQALGIAVPGEIAVIGFGDLDYAANTSPPLSSVSVDRFAVGRLAAEAILTRLGGGEPASAVIDVGFDIVERGTT